jgi:hypothetical protein
MVRHNPSDARRQRRAASARGAASHLMTCTSEVVHPHLFHDLFVFDFSHDNIQLPVPLNFRASPVAVWKRSYLYRCFVPRPASPTDATQPYCGCVSG